MSQGPTGDFGYTVDRLLEYLKDKGQIYSAAQLASLLAVEGYVRRRYGVSRGLQELVENWVKLLESRGVKVYRPRLLTDDELRYQDYLQGGAASIFVKDPLTVVGNIVIEGGNRVPFRRKDVFGYRHILRERVLGSGVAVGEVVTSGTPALLHAVDCGSAEKIEVGSRVEVSWRDERHGFITDIECFRLVGD